MLLVKSQWIKISYFNKCKYLNPLYKSDQAFFVAILYMILTRVSVVDYIIMEVKYSKKD